MATWPTLQQVRDWIGVPEGDISDDQLQMIVDAERQIQVAYCEWPPTTPAPTGDCATVGFWDEEEEPPEQIPEAIFQALLRRCARAVAARGLPLGTLPAAASGVGAPYGLTPATLLLPRLDNDVERYEAPFRITATA